MRTDFYAGEIRPFASSRLPNGFLPCDGRLLLITEYKQLYDVIGVTYGGDNRTTFGLPDLRGKVVMHRSDQYPLADSGGRESVSLTSIHLPSHTHNLQGNSDLQTSVTDPSGNVPGAGTGHYSSQTPIEPMRYNCVSASGSGSAHDNMMPFLVLQYAIAYTGW